MKKLLLIFVCSFSAALAALYLYGRLENREPGRSLSSILDSGVPVRPAALETGAQPADFRGAARIVMPTVVSVDTLGERETMFRERYIVPMSSGSGVVISSDGYILTNNHVIAGSDLVRVRFISGKSLDAKVIGTDQRSDLAVLKVKASGLIPAELGSSKSLQIGQWVIAVGNPLGYENTVSVGVVSSLNRTLPTDSSILVDAVQTDAAINQGNSGGALANVQGQIVGINTAIASTTGGSVGIGFAIPIDRAKRVVDQILKYGHARYGVMGLRVDSRPGILSNPRAREQLQEMTNSEPPERGALVQSVSPSSPAGNAGLQPLDVILNVAGVEIKEPIDYYRLMMDREPGQKVPVKVWSKGQVRTVQLTLAASDA